MNAKSLDRIDLRLAIVAAAMLAAAGLAVAMKPTTRIAEQRPKVDLETMIPEQFGDWRMDRSVPVAIVNPQQQVVLSKIYSQTLSRTYVSTKGERMMLSMAYGADQSDAMQVHKPEVCYPAQGFQIVNQPAADSLTWHGPVSVKRLVAARGSRVEPITYWLTIGDTVATDGLQWKLAQLKYGLTGKIPDGLLFRVSSINPHEQAAFNAQDQFIGALLEALDAERRNRLIGGRRGE